MSTHQPIPEEEIDLGNFFNQLIKLIKQFFAFIAGIFRGIYRLFINCLIFYRKHFLPLTAAIIIGVILGIIVNRTTPAVYHYKMILEPKYESAYHINSRIGYYNNLIKYKDVETLKTIFNVTDQDAESLLKFKLESEEDTKTLYDTYDDYIREKDTLTQAQIEFEDYSKKDFSDYDSKYYNLYLYLKNRTLEGSVQEGLLKDLENNSNLKEQQQLTLERLTLKEQNLKKLLIDIDSVRTKNKQIALIAAQNGDDQATFDFYKNDKHTDSDVNLLEFYKKTTMALDSVLIQKKDLRHIYNVVTPFESMGIAPKKWYQNPMLIYPMFLFLLTALVLLRKPFFNYLDRFNK